MRKKMIVGLLAALMITGAGLWGQESGEIDVGVLLESAMGTRKGISMEGGIIGGYGVTDNLSIGIKADYGHDFSNLGLLELLGYGRYYLPLDVEVCRLWAQMGTGVIVLMEGGKEAIGSVMVDMEIGVRFSVGSFYGEPYIRFGYPVLVGAGAVFGYRF
jgi:hypothetical protein